MAARRYAADAFPALSRLLSAYACAQSYLHPTRHPVGPSVTLHSCAHSWALPFVGPVCCTHSVARLHLNGGLLLVLVAVGPKKAAPQLAEARENITAGRVRAVVQSRMRVYVSV